MMKRSIIVAVLMMASSLLADPAALQEETNRLEVQADELLKLKPAEQKEVILKMSAPEAEALMNTLSRRVLAKNADAGPVFYLYEHLASLDAIDLAQKRLDRLLAVFVVTLLLFVGYLLFLLVQQNRIIRILKSNPSIQTDAKSASSVQVYRGE